MKARVLLWVFGLWMVLSVPGIALSQGEKAAAPKAPEGQIQSEEEPDREFQQARENFLKKNLKESAAAIRRGVGSLKSAIDQATGKGKEALESSAGELEKLAERVEKGTVKSVKELDRTFARANHALAEHHLLKTSESWAKKETSRAGRSLKAATDQLERGLNRAGDKIEAKTKSAIDKSRRLAEKLGQGVESAGGEVEKQMKALGEQIKRLGKKVTP